MRTPATTYSRSRRRAIVNLRRARAIKDPEVLSFLDSVMSRSGFSACLGDERVAARFVSRYYEWVQSSTLNRLSGLNAFQAACYSQGTTESFTLFYAKHSGRRFRCLKGEYFFHHLSWRNHYPGWAFVDSANPIGRGDAFVISLPFSDTGGKHPDMEALIERCDGYGVPVLVDCVYLGLCRDIEFDLDRPCIEAVTFSLSKVFPVAHARIGMRLDAPG